VYREGGGSNARILVITEKGAREVAIEEVVKKRREE
jgi:hypothetical protein